MASVPGLRTSKFTFVELRLCQVGDLSLDRRYSCPADGLGRNSGDLSMTYLFASAARDFCGEIGRQRRVEEILSPVLGG